MTPRSKTDLTSGSLTGHLMRLSVPMIWGILAIVSIQLADVYFMGLLGQRELEAIAFTFPVSMTIFNLLMGISIGTASISARLIGAGDQATFKTFVAQAIVIAALMGVVLAALGTAVLDPVIRVLGAGPEHRDILIPYLSISLWGTALVAIPLVINAALRAMGDTVMPSLTMVFAALVNIPLSYALIFGPGFFPALGPTGAAMAHVISYAMLTCVSLVLLVRRTQILNLTAFHPRALGPSARRLFPIAIPIGLMNLVQPASVGIITAWLATTTSAAVAAYGIVGRVEAVAAVVLMALAIGLGPVVGQNYGAGNKDRVWGALKRAIIFSVVFSGLVGVVLMTFGRMIAHEFTDDAMTVSIVGQYFWIIGLSYALANLSSGWATVWNALGMPRYTVTLTLTRFVLGVLLPAWMGLIWGGWQGLFIGLFLGNMVLGLALHFWCVGRLRGVIGPQGVLKQ